MLLGDVSGGGGGVGWAGAGGGKRRVDGFLLLGSWKVELWCGAVWVVWDPGAFSEVDGCVSILWEMMVVSEAFLELEL